MCRGTSTPALALKRSPQVKLSCAPGYQAVGPVWSDLLLNNFLSGFQNVPLPGIVFRGDEPTTTSCRVNGSSLRRARERRAHPMVGIMVGPDLAPAREFSMAVGVNVVRARIMPVVANPALIAVLARAPT